MAMAFCVKAPAEYSRKGVFRKVRFQAPLNLVRPIKGGTTHSTLRPSSNNSQLLALRAAVLRRAVSHGTLETLRRSGPVIESRKAAVAYAGQYESFRASP